MQSHSSQSLAHLSCTATPAEALDLTPRVCSVYRARLCVAGPWSGVYEYEQDLTLQRTIQCAILHQ